MHHTVKTIIDVLMKKYITFPIGNSVNDVVSKCGFLQCAGAIDGSHITVQAPCMNHTDYYNRKGWYSILSQAVVESDYLFWDVNVRWPGSVHDAHVFSNSTLNGKATSDNLLQGHSRNIEGKSVAVCLVGDSGYLLLRWLLKPFPFNGDLSTAKKTFNYKLSRARIVSEIAFGRLKARWCRLSKQNEMIITNVTPVVIACCVLHNICEIHGSTFSDDWLNGITLEESESEEPATSTRREESTEDFSYIIQALIDYCI